MLATHHLFKELLMRTHFVLAGISIALIACADLSQAQSAQPTRPLAGQWEFNTDMKGMPMGGGVKTGKVCIQAEAMAAGVEKALVEAAMTIAQPADEKKSDKPKCNFTDIQREANSSRWKSTCAGPRGAMQGTGSGNFNTDSAQLTQAFEVSLPFGKRTLTQTITAKRIGECV
jgi:Protein of unknown function (DUF3617)